ncbi:MAG: hypothetical protein NC489_11995 [Ruminococcus flavefaciens]|nr:hypothetical protein [Ruminococcus flavefaciens]
MKDEDLYDAFSGIDEKYISDSENFSEISADFRRAKMKKIGTVSSLCASLLILSAVFFNDVTRDDFNSIPDIAENPGTVQTDISSDVIITTENKTAVTEITETTVNSSGSTVCLTSNILTTVDNADNFIAETVLTETQVIETSEIPTTDILIPTDCDGITDGYDKADFSGISVDEWLENTAVVWVEGDTKGYINSEYITAGNAKISDELSALMQNNSDDIVYAVMVDFSSCIDEDDLLNWEYNGDTIADLKLLISESTEYSENSYTYTDSDGTEHVEYFLTPESEERVTAIEHRIDEIRSTYRNAKIQGFRDSFYDNRLEIYSGSLNGMEADFFFYTFATRKHLEEFKCKDDEAFIFYPANYFK